MLETFQQYIKDIRCQAMSFWQKLIVHDFAHKNYELTINNKTSFLKSQLFRKENSLLIG